MFSAVLLFTIFVTCGGYRLQTHPLEPRIAYLSDLKPWNQWTQADFDIFRPLLVRHPLLVFKGFDTMMPPTDFLHFVKQFDPDRDSDALDNPDEHPHQMLQPFDQFPECRHVAPRGNIQLDQFHQIESLKVAPGDAFLDKYVWHTDMIGHEYKLPNVITAFHICENPLIGGETEFISGETVYEHLTTDEKKAAHNVLVDINRLKFLKKQASTDYAGVQRLEPFDEEKEGTTQIPLVFAPDRIGESPRIVLMPSFFERIVGWSVEDSRAWIRDFMNKKVLPHRVTVQWKRGDVAVFHNRRFLHSSTPARNYLDNPDSHHRFLLQTFVPTKMPLHAFLPQDKNAFACFRARWTHDPHVAGLSCNDHVEFAKKRMAFFNETVDDRGIYVFFKSFINCF